MTSRRLITAIFIAAFIIGLGWGGHARGMVTGFLIEGADEARYESLTQSYSLTSLLDALGTHFVVDMADGLRHAPLTYPVGLHAFLDAMPMHFIVDMADGLRHAPLVYPAGLQTHFDTMPAHFVIDMADGNRFRGLTYPRTLIGDATPPGEEGTPEIVPAGTGSVKVRWKTNEFSRGTIEYGPVSGQYTQSVAEPLYMKDHELTLTGLAKDSRYYYRISYVDPAGNSGRGVERSFATGAESKQLYLPVTIKR